MKIINIIFTGIIIASVIWHTVKKNKVLMTSLKKLNALRLDFNNDLNKQNEDFKKQTRQAIIKEIWIFITTLIILWAAGLFNVIFEVIR